MKGLALTIALTVCTCLLLVISQLLLKRALQQVHGGASGVLALSGSLLKMPTFWMAVTATGMGSVVWLFLLRAAPVSTVYPLLSLSYVIMVPAARLAFGEPITLPKLGGTILICLGVFIIARPAH